MALEAGEQEHGDSGAAGGALHGKRFCVPSVPGHDDGPPSLAQLEQDFNTVMHKSSLSKMLDDLGNLELDKGVGMPAEHAALSRKALCEMRFGVQKSCPRKRNLVFDTDDAPNVDEVYQIFQEVYSFFSDDALDPYALWLLTELCDFNKLDDESKWDVIFECIPTEGLKPMSDEKANHKPAEVADAHKVWLANPNRQWDVWDMKTLSEKIKEKCLEWISPSCWQSWNDPPKWCPLVVKAFDVWNQIKPALRLDLDRIHSKSILARISEENFRTVKRRIDRTIRSFRNWNEFCRQFLIECDDCHPSNDDHVDLQDDVDLQFDHDSNSLQY
jgi:hypothetical protein